MQVDFEERVDFRRLHTYRLERARQALKNSDCGALLLFDSDNIRYITGTVIGEWARDKLCRFALLTGNGEPIIWDFGSAASPSPALLRLAAAGKLPRRHARHARHRAAVGGLLQRPRRGDQGTRCVEAGVADMPLGVDVVEPPMFFELQKVGHEGASTASR